MGGNGVAMTGDYSAMFTNPAANYFLDKNQSGISYSKIYEDIGFAGFGMAIPTVKSGGFGIGIGIFDYGDFVQRSGSGARQSDFSRTDNIFLISYANYIGQFSFGANIKYRQVNLKPITKESGQSFDFGILWKKRLFNLGLSVIDPAGWKIGENKVANPNVKFGFAIKPVKPLSLYSDFDLPNYEMAKKYSLGIEFEGVPGYFIRGGLSYQTNVEPLFTAGIGVPIEKAWGFDYSFLSNAELGIRHFVSTYFKFGENVYIIRGQKEYSEKLKSDLNTSRREVEAYAMKIGKKFKIAVLELVPVNLGEREEEMELFSEMIRAYLVKTKICFVMERGDVEEIIKEHKLGMTGITMSNILDLGKFLTVDFIIYCNLNKIGDEYCLNGKAIHKDTGEIYVIEEQKCRDLAEMQYRIEIFCNRLIVNTYKVFEEKIKHEMEK